MRTTIELPDELHRQALSIARDSSRSLSQVIAELVRRGLGTAVATPPAASAVTGLPVVTLGRIITTEDVRSLDDDR